MKANLHLSLGYLDVGRHVDEVAEDLPGLGIGIATHLLSERSVESTGNRQQRHIEVHLQPYGRRQGVHVEKPNGVRERVFNQHALGVPSDELFGGYPALVAEHDGWFVVAEILDK